VDDAIGDDVDLGDEQAGLIGDGVLSGVRVRLTRTDDTLNSLLTPSVGLLEFLSGEDDAFWGSREPRRRGVKALRHSSPVGSLPDSLRLPGVLGLTGATVGGVRVAVLATLLFIASGTYSGYLMCSNWYGESTGANVELNRSPDGAITPGEQRNRLNPDRLSAGFAGASERAGQVALLFQRDERDARIRR